MLLTLGVLVVGLVVMGVGGKINKEYSNKLMAARVWLQAITIGIILLAFLVVGR